MTGDLFEAQAEAEPWSERLGPGTHLLHNFAGQEAATLLTNLEAVVVAAPFRHMITPGGVRMSVAMTNCGTLGWVTDRRGYRYDAIDPQPGCPWPAMPASFSRLAQRAAAAAGFEAFEPNACLINRYAPGARLSLHQDKDEGDFRAPIVSVSLGIPALFLLGGSKRTDQTSRMVLTHGDVLVWGGPDRLRYHGVLRLKPGHHSLVGECRINLTFRRVA
jgi:alkylated DNA repair protein (DNA oxidative demethylase)